jgi:CRP/FNR family transcriptional regulator, cyclic AMP receptor protein
MLDERTGASEPAHRPHGSSPAYPSPHARWLAQGITEAGLGIDFAEDIDALMGKTPLFSGLQGHESRMLAAAMRVYDVPAGLAMINEGEAGDFMILLMHGSVDVWRRGDSNARTRIAVAQAGQALGEMSMLDGEPRFASCVAVDPCRIAVLTRDALMQVLSDAPALGNRILLKLVQLLSERLRQTSAQLVAVLGR